MQIFRSILRFANLARHSTISSKRFGNTAVCVWLIGVLVLSLTPAVSAQAQSQLGFTKGELQNIGNIKPTTLQFGPGGKLYAADWKGYIEVYDIVRTAPGTYSVTSTEIITVIRDIVNHDDDGSPNLSVSERLVTGILVTGTAANPVIYVNSSDPRIGGGPSSQDTNLDTNSGVLSKITKNAGQWQRIDIVRGLPRSEENHHSNGLAIDPATNKLYIGSGGNTNQGAPSNNFTFLPEYALSAAILEIDLNVIGDTTYDIPTLDDEDRTGVNDFNDPFGGNNGKNQAMLVQNGPVQVYAPGFRNPYDVVLTQAGHLYSIDNGPNAGWGAVPVGVNTNNCTNDVNEPGETQKDRLHLITGPGYFGGHSNPTRGNINNTFNVTNPQSPIWQSNPIECDYVGSGNNSSGLNFPTSTNGLAEYTASNFGSEMMGDLLTVGYDNKVYRIDLDNNGDTFLGKSELFSSVGAIPLDVVAQGDFDVFPGTIWVAEFVQKKIIVFEPDDYDGAPPVCDGEYNTLDEDNDSYTNADEIDNGTNPCSGADFPSDADIDGISDLNDPDDDNDGVVDSTDAFALDPSNGRDRALPLSYTWENNSAPAGYLFNLGFSGLMSNGQTDYLTQFDSGELTGGGAAGVFTIDNAPTTDAAGSLNNQTYAFQFGVDATPQTEEFKVHTRVLAPFAGVQNYSDEQSQGLYIGTGDQDNYIKIVVASGGVNGMVKLISEIEGVQLVIAEVPAAIYGAESVDLSLIVNPADGTVTGSYSLITASQSGPDIDVLPSTALPVSWLSGTSGLAIGIISSSLGAESFPATWDFIEVEFTANQQPTVNAGNDGSVVIDTDFQLSGSVADDGKPNNVLNTTWSQLTGPGLASFDDFSALNAVATFDTIGSYELELYVSDGELFARDTITVNVTEPPSDLDSDSDGIPDIIDNDDDNDGLNDNVDPFALDQDNGRANNIPINLTWDSNHGYLFGSGFSGLMSNGSEYSSLYDITQMDIDGGVFTVNDIPPGDPHQSKNNQQFGFQFGINVTTQTAPFTVRTRIVYPFGNVTAPKQYQSMGLYIGTGDQDNYIKAVANSDGPSGGLEFAKELNKVFTNVAAGTPTVYGADAIDLLLDVDPATGLVSASYQTINSGLTGEMTLVGTTTLPAEWINGANGLAVGIISTSFNATPFDVSWDVIEVTYQGGAPSNQAPVVSAGSNASIIIGDGLALTGSATDDGLPDGVLITTWSQSAGPAGSTATFGDTTALNTSVTFDTPGIYELTLSGSDGLLDASSTISVTVSDGTPIVDDADGDGIVDSIDPDDDNDGITDGDDVFALDDQNGLDTSIPFTLDWSSGHGGLLDSGFSGLMSNGNDYSDLLDVTRVSVGGGQLMISDVGPGDPYRTLNTQTEGLQRGVNVTTQTEPFIVKARINTPFAGTSSLARYQSMGVYVGNGDQDNYVKLVVNTDGSNGGMEFGREVGANFQGVASESGIGIYGSDAVDLLLRIDAGAGEVSASYQIISGGQPGTVMLMGTADLPSTWVSGNTGLAVGLISTSFAATPFDVSWDSLEVDFEGDTTGNTNTAPVVSAGADSTITLGDVLTLSGTVSDDGLPNNTLSTQWSQTDGQGTVVFSDDLALSTTATFPTEGTYVLQLSASDGDLSTIDTVIVAVTNDSSGNTWQLEVSSDSSVPVARHETGATVSVNGRFYLLGGRGVRPTSIYDPTTRTWIQGAAPPIELHHYQPVEVDGLIYAIGAMTGSFPEEPSVANVYTYSPSSDTWAEGSAIPVTRLRGGAAAAVNNGKIYVIGGNTNGHSGPAVSWLDEYDPATGIWRELPDAPSSRDHTTVAIIDGKLIVAGGRETQQPNTFGGLVSSVDIFDFSSESWQTVSTIPTPRAGTMVVATGGELIVMGGEIASSAQALNTVEAYNVGSNTWRTLPSLMQRRHSGGASIINDRIHVVAGSTTRGGSGETSSHESLLLPIP